MQGVFMLTSLYIRTPQYRFKIISLLSAFYHNSLKIEIKQLGKIQIKTIEYVCRNHKVNWKKLDKVIGAQRNRLLCSTDVPLPQEMGFKRFVDNNFKYRMCTNLAICLLSSIKAHVTVGVIDTDASFTPIIKYLLKYTDSVVVVTNESEIYKEVAENLLHDLGAPIRLSKNPGALCDCDLIVAPKGIDKNIILKQNAVVLTTQKPDNKVPCTVINDYEIDLNNDIENICPKGIDKTYFASALYTHGHMFELGSYVPQICISDIKLHTVSSLKRELLQLCDKNLT